MQKISRLSGNLPGYRETFQAIPKFSGSSGKYPDNLESFSDYPETFCTVKYPDNPENFKTIRKLFRQSGNFQDGPETSQCNFKGYAQRLSGWQYHDAMMVFGSLMDWKKGNTNRWNPLLFSTPVEGIN